MYVAYFLLFLPFIQTVFFIIQRGKAGIHFLPLLSIYWNMSFSTDHKLLFVVEIVAHEEISMLILMYKK